ncbi:Phosphoserine phosphatase [Cordyceps militaris CM01]|uniref:Phosphoserine phosphatase n=1 Tax=Cordyceps militaris (strain CM01) TaxID=983644 RepID=G3J6B3_CORMM|nr:Phosphoserine phosphatase [Cordyceps militaris CM01]EGX95349.1 Phosphoserine phosphatase [Cordyceps militaris CM01]
MGSVNTDTPALATNPRFIFFTDFDGTITTADSNDYMIDNLGCGAAQRGADNHEVLAGRAHFRDVFYDMLDSVRTPFDECLRLLLANIRLDPGFKDFYLWARANNVPIVILSGGMEPVIRALLDQMLGPGWDMQVVSNDVAPAVEGGSIDDEGGWKIVFHDDSVFGHDKSIEIRKYSSLPERPVMFYAGDGVSDLSAAKETDLLFAKEGKDLVTWCENAKVPFVTFRDWTSIGQTVKDIVAGNITLQDAARGRI